MSPRFERPEKRSGKKSSLLVLDSNEYLSALGSLQSPSAAHLIESISDPSAGHPIRIPRVVVDEVRRNLSPEVFREFVSIVRDLTPQVDEDFVVPFELAAKYERGGLKPDFDTSSPFSVTPAAFSVGASSSPA